MASVPSRKRSQTQLTLFDCQTSRDKRSKLADDSSKEDCDQHDESFDHDSSNGWQDLFSSSDNELSGTEEDRYQTVTTNTPQSKYDQDNTINIDKPSGSTMIIINNGQSSSPSTSHPFTHSAAATATHTDFPSDIAQGPLQSPVQPRMKFPSTTVGNKKRSFNSDWYKNYKWLEYSVQKDAAFCYPCRFFATTT